MSPWSFAMSAAPHDRRVWLASDCGKVIGPTSWDQKREQWAGFATNGKPPIAWQPYIVPAHPNTNPEAKASIDNAAISATAAPAGREMRVGEAPRGSVPATSEGGRDSVERHATHFIIDDVGSV